MIRLERPLRPHDRQRIYSSVEVSEIKREGAMAVIECRSEIMARVAERFGFRRVAAPTSPAAAPPAPPAAPPAPPAAPSAARTELEQEVDRVLEGSVDDLDAALQSGKFDDSLAIVYVAERAGKRRKTALRAVLDRSRRIGVSFDVP